VPPGEDGIRPAPQEPRQDVPPLRRAHSPHGTLDLWLFLIV
jgi:hypothetical protein